VKADSTTTTSPADAAPPVALAPGYRFFLRRLELPKDMAAAEVPGFAALQWEELSPFPVDQLFHGQLRATDGSAVFVYAAYRRSFSNEQAEAWKESILVLPEFAPVLRLEFARQTLVFLRTAGSLGAFLFEGGRKLPARAAVRPLAPDAPPDAVEAMRRCLVEQVAARGASEVALRLATPPRYRAKGLEWVLEPDGSGRAMEVFISHHECWAMDVRDPVFVEQQRRRLGFDVVLWRIVLGAAAVLALLIAGELLLFGGRTWVDWRRSTVKEQAPRVAALETKDLVANRLDEFGRASLRPFEMLAAVSAVKPENVWFVSTTAEAGTNLRIEGRATNAAEINTYVTALRASPPVREVPDANVRSAADGTTFTLTVTFKLDAFAPRPSAGATNAAAGQGGGP
jgi:hypothetical protein